MWRAYGANGNGVALIINTEKITPLKETPLLLGKVGYRTDKERIDWFESTFVQLSTLLSETNVHDDKLYEVAFAVFETLKLSSLFTKHRGFDEEEEWRVVYLSKRDAGKEVGWHEALQNWNGRRRA